MPTPKTLTLEQILKIIKDKNNSLDGITNDTIKLIEKYQKQYDAGLLDIDFDTDNAGNLKSSTKNINKLQSYDPIKEFGFEKLAISHTDTYDAVIPEVTKSFLNRLGMKTIINYKNLEFVKDIKKLDISGLLNLAKEHDNVIKKAMINNIVLNTSYKKAVSLLKTDLLNVSAGRLVSKADAILRTSTFGMHNLFAKETYDKIGGNLPNAKYLYSGPTDKKTRPFCLRHVNKIYTLKEVQDFGKANGSGLNAFFSPGGYRCRHDLIFVGNLVIKK